MKFIESLHPRKPGTQIIFSYALFLLFMFLDFLTTEYVAQGNVGMEGNIIAVIWWKLTGELRHIGIPIWMAYVLGIAYLLNTKSEFLALWWVNGLAFGHLSGWLSWSQNPAINSFFNLFYFYIKNDYLLTVALSGFGMLLGLLFAFLQTKLGFKTILKFLRI